MKLRTWTLALALAASLAAGAAQGASGAARSGVRVYVESAPICHPAKHVCTRVFFTGWDVQLIRNGRVVARGTSKGKAGVVLYGSPGGGYSIAYSGVWKGLKISHRQKLPPLVPGVVYPDYLENCVAGVTSC